MRISEGLLRIADQIQNAQPGCLAHQTRNGLARERWLHRGPARRLQPQLHGARTRANVVARPNKCGTGPALTVIVFLVPRCPRAPASVFGSDPVDCAGATVEARTLLIVPLSPRNRPYGILVRTLTYVVRGILSTRLVILKRHDRAP